MRLSGPDGAIPLNKGNDVEIEEGIRVHFAAEGITCRARTG